MKDILSAVSNHHRGCYRNADEKEFAEKNLEFLFQHVNWAGVWLNLYRCKADSLVYVVPEVRDNGKVAYWSAYVISEEAYSEICYDSNCLY